MTSFGWKRKVGQKVSREASTDFEKEAKDDEDEAITSGEIDWLSLMPARKVICLEDAATKATRLKAEGTTLAEQERYWQALKKWDAAIELSPQDETLHEMKAQALMQLGEVLAALKAAQQVVSLKPTWWVAYQTLGRAYLGLGEVKQALLSFCKAVHLNPADKELWQEDLLWAYSLVHQKQDLLKEAEKMSTLEESKRLSKIIELDNEENNLTVSKTWKKSSETDKSNASSEDSSVHKTMPSNYIYMRD